jgi:hypothetical protein
VIEDPKGAFTASKNSCHLIIDHDLQIDKTGRFLLFEDHLNELVQLLDELRLELEGFEQTLDRFKFGTGVFELRVQLRLYFCTRALQTV